MKGKIALEEHFAIPDTAEDSIGYFPPAVRDEVRARNADIHGRRLALMDEFGIEMMLLSLNAPAVQAIPDPGRAAEIARKANDYLAEQAHKRPTRFQGLAALAMQDPDGAAVNGFSQINDADTPVYYDLPQYRSFWATVERLDVPFYLHPRNPLQRDARIYEGHPWLLGPIWAFGQETAVHALRLMASGLFDAYPRLQIILGHMGENLPFGIWRVDNSNAWIPNRNAWPAKRPLGDYFRANFYLTTSGNFRTQALVNAMMEIGADRIMFSTDWPFENIDHAANWFDACPISENDREKIGRGNARRLFKLGND